MKIGILAAFAALWLLPATVEAQTPDNDDVSVKITTPASPYYYPNLMMRYRNGESLSADEYHYLYYGYAFQEGYKPLAVNEAATRVLQIMARLKIDEPSIADLEELVGACNDALEQDPFSPQMLNMLAYAYGGLGDKAHEKNCYDRLNGVLKTIAASGDGVKDKSPMHIIMFQHALDYIASKGWNYSKGRVISRTVEFVPFNTPHDRLKGYYFDYSRIYWNKPDGYTFKRDRTWQFNNLKPREYK